MIEEFISESICPLMTIVGAGSVGCKITHGINYNDESFQQQDIMTKLYVHTSQDVLMPYSTDTNSKHLLLTDHIHFFETEIRQQLQGRDMVFIIAAFGGENGSKIPHFIAKIAKDLGVLCIGLFSFPFEFEGRNKQIRSQQAYLSIKEHIDGVICIENDRFLDSGLKTKSVTGINELFNDSNCHFKAVITGLLNLIVKPGMINVDFSDIRQILQNMGLGTVGYGFQSGEKRAEHAVINLLKSPALASYDLSKAQGLLINIIAGLSMTLYEFEDVGNAIKGVIGDNAKIVIGTSLDIDMDEDDKFEVTAIITGLPDIPIDQTLKTDEFDIVKLSKSITFEAHQASAGLSILSYFNEFLHQQYAGIEAKIKIEQVGNNVILVVETLFGEVQRIEKSLHDFGLLVVKKIQPENVLQSSLDVDRFKMKLEMSEMELRHTQNMLHLYQSENENYKSRVLSLEHQMENLQSVICSSLSMSQNHMSSQLSFCNDLPENLIGIIEKYKNRKITDSDKHIIEQEIKKHVIDRHSNMELKKFAENSLYGMAGNALYNLIISVLSTLPLR
ncbi:cell division protein FtsZ [Vibrio parahaemolyticus]|uniref:cell division protein FtsZ n=1 Tax=Vibrio parahaemolyticus TaxID=670 RepID=UPI001B828BBE|nr:cell division protein FtsZ [Vibrio parahaemolyticus]MCR9727937.1 cell division FtsZ family protein [Vibrio parahaemolyticus]MCR9750356.1 cell division FtsZ family protein [Vibrio parahaemolyticus]MCR9784062.1 cell division FtsZ family protein [Vibrio parahaemolyticus]MCR9859676.1 cell division FtsZ family protein [Vibrio parahaemolyticus]MDG3417985.1 cell division protein FtsZ [Vibrio parahaemolyticus]